MKLKFTLKLALLTLVCSCSSTPSKWQDINEEGKFLVYRRQSQIGEETYSITSNKDTITVTSIQGENERGRISGVESKLYLTTDLEPLSYVSRRISNKDTTNIFKMEVDGDQVSIWEKHFDVVTSKKKDVFFGINSNIPAGIEMMLYHFYLDKNIKGGVSTLPRGEVSMTFKKKDTAVIKGAKIPLDRYVVEGVNWGGRTIWLDEDENLIAIVKANTQIRELIREGYEEAKSLFIAGNVEEQISALQKYTSDLKGDQANIKALVGGDIIDGVKGAIQKNMTIIIENGKIKEIGSSPETKIPENAKVIDVKGKTLMPGMWDMHAHSNQVQWAPAYLAGGVTTIRDNGNELEFATAFRDEIAKNGALGPDILLAGMTDGPGPKGNGIIRARSVEEAKEVVALYHKNGYEQIKIYSSIEPEILKVLAEEAHKIGMTVTGHVPNPVNDTRMAVEGGMDMLSHYNRILAALFTDKKVSDIGPYFMVDNEVTDDMVNDAIAFYLKHGTVLDVTFGLGVMRTLPKGNLMETIEPDAYRMAYELFEGKRFRAGTNPLLANKSKLNIMRSGEVIGKFYKAGIPIVAGTDNFAPGFALFLELESYVKFCDLTPLDAIKTATIIPAKAMGYGDVTGTLEVGKEADIAILEKNPLENIENIRTVEAVITNGNYYESEPLWHATDFKAKND
ncbi:amidohydrolase family protein [Cellulophaga baltica]|uniref:amidohydrolase family protein n=1 Tax=Cellulophaga TaxID=104264 RepID=UPI001C07E826|nr:MULTISPECIES: amidohydrolase family protein [Cellulophaga]MBU2995849.1 amidohydrolase family protein [Cellulophaga baltica]MDO6767244.1 amidohydrolase family protein [Cellulophaga sp. 1_MG-2023]